MPHFKAEKGISLDFSLVRPEVSSKYTWIFDYNSIIVFITAKNT